MKKTIVLIVLLLTPLIVNAKSMTAVEYIGKIASDNNADKTSINAIGNTGLAYDGTVDNNLRYIGVNPNNYVDIGDRYKTDIYAGYQWDGDLYRFYSSEEECKESEFYNNGILNIGCKKIHSKGDKILWRIIGVMNNIETINGKETKLKLRRAESLGWYTIDSSPAPINGGTGISEWEQTDLNHILNAGYESVEEDIYKYVSPFNCEYVETKKVNNSFYWNSEKGLCIEPNNNSVINNCDFRGTGLTESAKMFIDEVVWDTGTYSETDYYDVISTPATIYNWERTGIRNRKDSYSHETANDTVERTAKWTGKIGIMYISDLGFSAAGSDQTSRDICLSINMMYGDGLGQDAASAWFKNKDCLNSSWLNENSPMEATMTFDDQYGISSSFVYGDEEIYTTWITNPGNVHPVFYLNNDAVITTGDGTSANPYQLRLEKSASIEVKISSKKELNKLFNDIGNDIKWVVKDTSILKIENNTIIPLKVGVTEVTGEKDNIIYNLKVVVTDDFFINPKTSNNFIIIIIILFSIILFRYFMINHNTKINR